MNSRLTQHPQRAPREISESEEPGDNLAARTLVNDGQTVVIKFTFPYTAALNNNNGASRLLREESFRTEVAVCDDARTDIRQSEDRPYGFQTVSGDVHGAARSFATSATEGRLATIRRTLPAGVGRVLNASALRTVRRGFRLG